MLRQESTATGLDLGQRSRRSLDAHDSTERVVGASRPLQRDPQKPIPVADIVSVEQMRFALQGREKYVGVTVIVKVGKDRSSTIRDRVQTARTGDFRPLAGAIAQRDEVSFKPAERETLFEDRTHVATVIVLVPGVLCFFGGGHNVAPEEASRIFHGLARDESVRGVEILETVIVEVEEASAKRPPGGKAASLLGDVVPDTVALVLVNTVSRGKFP